MSDQEKSITNNKTNQKKLTDHTEGSIIGSILKMGLPSMIGFGLGNIYSLVDMYWLSGLGPEAVAALTIAGPMLWVAHSANHIVGVGSVAIISRRYGEKNVERTERSIKDTILLKWIAALFFGFLGYLLAPWALDLLGAEGEVHKIAVIYSRIIFIGLGFNFATYSVFTSMRGTSNPNIAMALMISLSVFNIILDPFMIFGWWIFPAWGVKGAAWASVISYALAFIVGMIIMYAGGTNIKLRLWSREKIRYDTMWRILKIGAPAAVGSFSFTTSRAVIMPIIATYGTGVVAAYGVSQHIAALGVMLMVGIGLGLSALIGHNLGAKKFERARETASQAIRLAVGIMTFLGLMTVIFARYIMGQFFEEPEIIEYGITILYVSALALPFLGAYFMMENIYTGVGENKPIMTMDITSGWLMQIPSILICVHLLGMNQNSVWWCMSISNIAITWIFYLYYRRGNWLHVKV
ncbi:MAG: MATE family efflux transporter [Candidatus Zixiibacteriota bacterium]